MNRQVLFQHLQSLGTPESLQSLVRTCHEQTHYNLIFQGHTYPIPVGKGVRQGCPIAPLLWLVYMDRLLHDLAPLTGPSWIQRCLTLYADDLHIGCIFDNLTEFRQHLVNIGHVLDVIESLHLTLSYAKSFVLLAATGTNSRVALKGIVLRTQKGTCIRIPRATQDTELPIKATGSYLGVTMSYKSFETDTWTRRRQAGWSAFQRLSMWLKARSIPVQHRLYLWHTCIHTVLTYGLLAVQLTPSVLHEYQSTVFRMLRVAIGDHAYLTHHTHQQALLNFGIPTPLELLSHLAMSLQSRLSRRTRCISANDILHDVDWTHLTDTIHLLQTVHQATAQVTIARDPDSPICTQALHVCKYCSFRTHTLANLRRHHTANHHHVQLRTFPTDPIALSSSWKNPNVVTAFACLPHGAVISFIFNVIAVRPPN